MKRLMIQTLAAAAVTAFTAAAAMAQPYPPGPPGGPPGFYHPPGYDHPPGPGPGWHRWHRGDRFHGDRYAVNDWHHYRLRPPPPGYQWVRNGGEFVLIGVSSGVVVETILNPGYP